VETNPINSNTSTVTQAGSSRIIFLPPTDTPHPASRLPDFPRRLAPRPSARPDLPHPAAAGGGFLLARVAGRGRRGRGPRLYMAASRAGAVSHGAALAAAAARLLGGGRRGPSEDARWAGERAPAAAARSATKLLGQSSRRHRDRKQEGDFLTVKQLEYKYNSP